MREVSALVEVSKGIRFCYRQGDNLARHNLLFTIVFTCNQVKVKLFFFCAAVAAKVFVSYLILSLTGLDHFFGLKIILVPLH